MPDFRWETVALGAATPGPRSRHGLAANRDDKSILLFGGIVWEGDGRLKGDTWRLDRDGWQLLPARPGGPSPRHRGGMAFDDGRGVAVLFGGQDPAGTMLADTWLFSNGNWTGVRARIWGGPPVRCGHALAYDESIGQVVLFGGIAAGPHDRPLDDTWTFDGHRWRQVQGPGPSPRRYAAMAYDPTFEGLVLHGGAADDHGARTFGDAWLFRDRAWTPLPGRFGTDPRDDHGLAYHRAADALVMLEGVAGSRGLLAASPEGWASATCSPLHPRHQCSPLAWDEGRGGLVLHGGEARHGGPQFDSTLLLRRAAEG